MRIQLIVSAGVWLLVATAAYLPIGARAAERPNIVWISAEDISAATLGCYGGQAHTPRLDALARDGLRFDAAFSAAPVCAPSRSGIITGVMPTTLGSLPMRCFATAPPQVVGFPKLLRAAGYYCTNRAKTDYNFTESFDAGWNESSGTAHWRNRPDPQQPFFAVFNEMVTHESALFEGRGDKAVQKPAAEARRSPDAVRVPAYYPDTPVVRTALARRQELAALLDDLAGGILDQLVADGLADDTIVFFWGDHGEGIPHGKRSLTEHGLRVPLIVHVPERFRHAIRLADSGPAMGVAEQPVSLMDLGPTVLDLAGVDAPSWMEGRSFLGSHAIASDWVIGARDRMDCFPGCGRTIRDRSLRYVRHFMPWISGDDLPPYAGQMALTGELRALKQAGTLPAGAAWFARPSRPAEELFVVGSDPEEVHDVATAPGRRADLERLRDSLHAWMRSTRDTGILPEPMLRREAAVSGSEWAIFHPGPEDEAAAAKRYDAILGAAWAVREDHRVADFKANLCHADPAVRHWAACGAGWAAVRAADDAAAGEAAALLRPLLADSEPVVRITTARWVVACGSSADATAALQALAADLRTTDPDLRLAAVTALQALGDKGRPLWDGLAELPRIKGDSFNYAAMMKTVIMGQR